MLKCDFGNLQREIERLEAAGTTVLHLDVMDGHFVGNLSYGPMVIERMRDLTDLWFDAHLMISDPARYLDDYLSAGCNSITFHVEAVGDALPLLRRIRESGALAGIALNPGTSVKAAQTVYDQCDQILVMSVEPGFGGQSFIRSSLDKLNQLSQMISTETVLSIDGGVGLSTIGECARAGANMFVVGSAIFDASDYAVAIEELSIVARRHLVSSSTLEK